MTQSQRAKKAEQLRLAAQIIETGVEWELKTDEPESEWLGSEYPFVAAYKGDAGKAVAHGYEVRVKEPVIPVPEGWRELRDDEKDESLVEGGKRLSPDEGWRHSGDTNYAYASPNYRIIVPFAKPRVPLEPGGVPPGSVIRGAGEAKEPGHQGWCLITSCSMTGIRYWRHCDDPRFSKELTWHEMMKSEMQIKRPTDTGWQPCSKEAP